MDAAVPIEAAKEYRMKNPRRGDVVRTRHDLEKDIGILAFDVAKGDPGQPRGEILIERGCHARRLLGRKSIIPPRGPRRDRRPARAAPNPADA